MRLSHTSLLRYAGLFTWGMVSTGLLMYARAIPLEIGGSAYRLAIALPVAAYLAFGLAFWVATRRLDRPVGGWFSRLMLLLAMTVSAIAVSNLTASGLGAVLMMLMAAVVPWLLPVRAGAAWLVVTHVALVPSFMAIPDFGFVESVMQSVLYIGISGFVFVTGLVANQQALAREEQRRLNAELRATRALLAENTRVAERLRISRELHDLLGHHLTALSLNLEVAGHLTEGKPQEHVRQAHTLAKLLLTDVREAVSTMREDDRMDVSVALKALVEGLPGLEVSLQVDEPLAVHDPDIAHVLIRCVQEVVTNAVRHAQAQRLWLYVRRAEHGLQVIARDDGVGVDMLHPGNGLRGMRERVHSVGGQVAMETAAGQGFRIDIQLPLEARA